MNAFAAEIERVRRIVSPARVGTVLDVTGLTVRVAGLSVPIGSVCAIARAEGGVVTAQVVGFHGHQTLCMPLSDTLGIARGDVVNALPDEARVGVCDELVGRALDGLGRVIDGGPPIHPVASYPLYRPAPPALDRPRVAEPIATGIRAIDAMMTVGRGQRVGLFAGTGVGKSVLIGMIARHTDADVCVVGLVGERGREVNDFIAKDLGPQGRRKTVLVVSTSDESPVLRVRAGFLATTVAEYFRDRGKNVLLLMDSVTRLAMAQRQIGLAAGEPPTTKGYTPSVFAMLPQLLERAGRTNEGSITGVYNVLVEGDDINDPIGDAVRGTIDGHVWLSRALAGEAHYPAISVTDSISRLMVDIADTEHRQAARTVQRVLATWNQIEDLVNIGAYVPGSNPEFDTVIHTRSAVREFLRQDIDQQATFDESRGRLIELAGQIEQTRRQREAVRDKAAAVSASVAQNAPQKRTR